ncbi:hypothetical protein ACI3PK_13840, partial [Lactococcus cremoris]
IVTAIPRSAIGSMANMLVLKSFNQHGSVSKKKFFIQWTIMQFAGLIILTIVGLGLLIFINVNTRFLQSVVNGNIDTD